MTEGLKRSLAARAAASRSGSSASEQPIKETAASRESLPPDWARISTTFVCTQGAIACFAQVLWIRTAMGQRPYIHKIIHRGTDGKGGGACLVRPRVGEQVWCQVNEDGCGRTAANYKVLPVDVRTSRDQTSDASYPENYTADNCWIVQHLTSWTFRRKMSRNFCPCSEPNG